MADIVRYGFALAERAGDSDALDPDGKAPAAGDAETDSSKALLILIVLLIAAFLTSYVLKSKKIQAVHETVVSIFAGMVVGLILRLASGAEIRQIVSFKYQFFFNLLLPPIILASGFELHQGNFFRNIGTILTFAFAGTFISAVVLGAILYLWTRLPLDGLDINFIDAIQVGATLSATDPITILAIFNTYKVDPKLYTIIFGESILNDAIAIVLFETAAKYNAGAVAGSLTILSLFESIGIFLVVFFFSLTVGLVVGVATSLLLKFTHIRREPKIESCLIFLIAYSSYFLANAAKLSGIVSLLFCGICLKHYAYHNMSRRTQLTTKFVFSLTAQLTENFIFIYLGLSIFTDVNLEYKPAFILVTVVGICVARWCAVFPLSSLINWVIRYRASRRGHEVAEELPHNWKIMIFWAGLRGAVGVALAQGIEGTQGFALRATVLLVVILSVIIFGGTTARMLEILQIRTGVVDEPDSDDEFDIEPVRYNRRNGTANGTKFKNGNINLGVLNNKHGRRGSNDTSSFSTGSANGSPPVQPDFSRRSSRNKVDTLNNAEQGLLGHQHEDISLSDDENDLDLPPQARRSPATWQHDDQSGSRDESSTGTPAPMTARSAINAVLNATTEDAGNLFAKLDQEFIKPHLLLDPGGSSKHGGV